MKHFLLALIIAAMPTLVLAQKTEVLTLTASYSASNGGLHFSNAKGDTIFYCPNHPDVCIVDGKEVSIYGSDGGPGLDTKFAGKNFSVTYTIDDPTMTDNGDGPGVTASVTKIVVVTAIK